jgi:hypothetical protein
MRSSTQPSSTEPPTGEGLHESSRKTASEKPAHEPTRAPAEVLRHFLEPFRSAPNGMPKPYFEL